MSPELQPITVWGKVGPNPPRVAIILEELGLPYEIIDIPISDAKSPDYVAINPNGRLPAIRDPNTGLTLWESGAIVEYLIERYDPEHKYSFTPGTTEAYHAKQWLFFQASGQGPYYGQLGWFRFYHSEKLPSAIERYVKEINRVTGVLEGHLAKQKVDAGSDGPWLVGGKLSFADLVFVSWQAVISHSHIMSKEEYDLDSFPYVKEWLEKMNSRKMVSSVLQKSFAAHLAHRQAAQGKSRSTALLANADNYQPNKMLDSPAAPLINRILVLGLYVEWVEKKVQMVAILEREDYGKNGIQSTILRAIYDTMTELYALRACNCLMLDGIDKLPLAKAESSCSTRF